MTEFIQKLPPIRGRYTEKAPLGAGSISKWAYDLPKQLDTAFAKKQKLKA